MLLSEVMLHQTQAARVAPAFERFVARFPTVRSLASASRSEVIRAWAGLGYNRRAVALHRAARRIVDEHGGRIPEDLAGLLGLPGVGPYTAAAVAALANGAPVAAVDTNVRRVVARAALGVDTAGADQRDVARAADEWLDPSDPGGWNQAVMDLGREVCRPMPRCGACPLARVCAFERVPGVGAPAARRQGRFEGSSRQLRGLLVGALLRVPSATLASLARDAGQPTHRTAEAIRGLARDGLVEAGPAALAGRPRGRVRLSPL